MGISFFILFLLPPGFELFVFPFLFDLIIPAKLSPSRTYAGTKTAFPAQKIPWPLVAKI